MTAIRVELELKDGSFVSGMLRSGQSLKSFTTELQRLDPHFRNLSRNGENVIKTFKQADDASHSLLGTMRDVSIVMGAASLAFSALTGASGGVIGNIIKVNAEMERLRFQMQGLSSAADPIKDAADQVNYLRDAATRAPFSIKELTSTFVKLKASGTDPLNGSMQALVDGIAAFGGTDEQLHRVTLGITQMSGKSVVQMEEMRQQLGESMPTAMRLMARSMGVSVGELIAIIGTGTLDAKSSLEQFYDELERAYGGSAQKMMGTFSGQVTQMTANLQRLATTGELQNFFNTIKEKLQDFNDFLKSPDAQRAADVFGKSLTGIAESGEKLVKTVYDMRSEIKVLALAFSGFIALRTMGTAIGSIGLQFTKFNGIMGASVSSVRAASAGYAAAAASMGASASVASLAGARFGQAGAVIMGVSRGIAAALPWVTLIGTVAYYAAEKFGLLGDKTESAYDSLVKYGVESRAQAKEILANKEAELRANLEGAKNPAGYWKYAGHTDYVGYIKETKEELAQAEEALKQFLIKKQEYLSQASDREQLDAREKQDRKMNNLVNDVNAEYDRAQSIRDDAYAAELQAVEKQGGDVNAVREKYKKELVASRKQQQKDIIDIYKKELASLEAARDQAVSKSDEDAAAGLNRMIDYMLGVKRLAVEQLNGMDDFVSDPKLIKKPVDADKLDDKGNKVLQSLREDVAGLTADIKGADGAYAKMQARIDSGEFGTIESGGEKFRQLASDILEATKQKEALDDVLKGRKDASTDLKNLQEKVEKDKAALEARKSGVELSDADAMLAKLNAGLYTGLGPIENIRAAMVNLSGVTQTQGQISEQLGKVLRENTFGQNLIDQLGKVQLAMSGITGELNSMSGAAGMVNFGSFGGVGTPNVKTQVDGGILDLIARGESGGDYNRSLDNGRWTGGEKNLTGMTLNQIQALQAQMLSNPENRAKYGDGLGSSALGRYQIVGKTLKGLMASMNLSGDELFDEKMQDQMAARLVAGRGASTTGLRKEWTSLVNVSDAEIMAAYNKSTNGPTVFNQNLRAVAGAPVAAPSDNSPRIAGAPALPSMGGSGYDQMMKDQIGYTKELEDAIKALGETEKQTLSQNEELDRSDYLKKLKASAEDATKPVEELGKTYQKLLDDIRAGKLGSDKNVDAEQYKELLQWAQKVDAAEKARDTRKSAITDADREKEKLDQERIALNKEIAETQAKIKNPDYKGQSDDVAKLKISLDKYVESVKAAYGANSDAYKEAVSYRDQMVASGMTLEGAKIQADLSAQRRDLEDSLLTERQLRAKQLERDLAALDERADAMRKAGVEETQIVEMIEAQKAAIRAKYNKEAMTPMQQQMQQWGKLSENMQGATAQWMDSAATGIAGLITGTGDLSSVVSGILSDVANMGVRYAMSSMMPQKGAAAGAAAGGKGAAGKGAATAATGAATGKMGVGTKHTGGIVGAGASGVAKIVHGSIFSHAKKYHTGGVVGGIGGPKLSRGEIPIIAKKGEGVFTPEQMSAMGGFSANSQYQINSPITVNGSAGTPTQNDDLAKRMSKELDGTMRNIIQDEIRRQQRPGNAMNNRSR
jgi:tape measure domain-containing protein